MTNSYFDALSSHILDQYELYRLDYSAMCITQIGHFLMHVIEKENKFVLRLIELTTNESFYGEPPMVICVTRLNSYFAFRCS